jgi:hypothetical protein
MRAALREPRAMKESSMISEDAPTTLHPRYEPADAMTTVSGTNAPRIVLDVTTRSAESRSYQLSFGIYRVGRHDTCDVVVPDRSVSRAHLEVVVDDQGVRAIDLDSANGSYCNGVAFHELLVVPGSSIAIGSSIMRIQSVEPPRPNRAPSPKKSTQQHAAVPMALSVAGPPRFAFGSSPSHPSLFRSVTQGPDVVRLPEPPIARLSAPQIAEAGPAGVRRGLTGRRSPKLARLFVSLAVSSMILGGAVIAYPALIDPLCADYEWFGEIRQHARAVHSAIAELLAAV